ncbi:MAG: cyclic nucleotide-binding domain-containing protein [Lachnospiraceae bacterium]|nr:cyclic nucleotide-binding domain-containing protein [Lachnospiraceae bacterium]
MDIGKLKSVRTIREFFELKDGTEIKEGTRSFLEAMTEVRIDLGCDIVTVGHDSEDGMYIILSGTEDVYSAENTLINTLSEGDFIGELGLINEDCRKATVPTTSFAIRMKSPCL